MEVTFIYTLVLVNWLLDEPNSYPNTYKNEAYKTLEECEEKLDEEYQKFKPLEKAGNGKMFTVKVELDDNNKRFLLVLNHKDKTGGITKCVKTMLYLE